MNKANLLRVADAIEKHEIAGLGFFMGDWLSTSSWDRSGHNCGTTACVRGHAVAVMLGRVPNYSEAACGDDVERWLDLEDIDRKNLFLESPAHVWINDVTPQHAINTLRYAAEHDVVDWDAANPPEAEDVSAA